ncbi:hypothetical protein HQ585_08205 [candidate division KSB1 bacterium]|nr:hypothetical protein [candidate division KSB1 bacterium]
MIKRIIWTILMLTLIGTGLIQGQGREYEGPIDPAGDQAGIRESHMTGNRFHLYFNNQGRQGHWPFLDGSRFPGNSQKGLDLFDSNILIVGARVYIEQDTIPVTDMNDIQSRAPGELDTLYYCLSGRTDHAIDMSPDGTVEWGFQPVFGYFNVSSESPAMSTDPNSWPPEGWPSTGLERQWAGQWKGRFGPYSYAHLESYYVMNDAQDQENLQPDLPARYSPRAESNFKIGDIRPEVTTQYGLPWGGVGIRVATRGYQWDNPQTRDIIFWEYDVTNVSDYNLPEVVFGFLMDLGVGHFFQNSDGEDDVGSFNDELDLSYCWDLNGEGYSSYLVGTLGFAFLESPGLPEDQVDNDKDGITDEKRDNKATQLVDPYYHITNLQDFLDAYSLTEELLKEHWDADEDQDWEDGNDINGNGIYDSGELAGDDVGLDGIAPGEENYPGPDADGTEGNHKPDYIEGVNAEPNFAITDVSESDMLGLTSFHLFLHHQGGERWVTHDETCYDHLTDGILDDAYSDPTNLNQSFSSGTFMLPHGRTERISMAVIASFENLATLNDERIAPIQFERKKVVQTIYEADYRFARPPIMPLLTATPSDGRVLLSWDNRSDRDTRESLLNGENDFEGYRLYKSTDINFSDAEVLRDGFGNPAGKLPIFMCDIKNDYFGFTDFAYVEGEGYYLGDNTGIQHYYIDENVDNGRTYYYYLTAYDHGIEIMDIAPSENVATIIQDENEVITFNTPNVAIVTPRPPVNDYIAPEIELLTNMEDIVGTGTVTVDVAAPQDMKENHTYKLSFIIDSLSRNPRIPEDLEYMNSGFRIYDLTEDTLVYEENPEHFVRINILSEQTSATQIRYYLNDLREVRSDIFDGLQLRLNDLTKESVWDSLGGTGWIQGFAPMTVEINRSKIARFPWQYDLVFTTEEEGYTPQYTGRWIQDAENDRIDGTIFKEQMLPFYVENKFYTDTSTGEFKKLEVICVDANENETFDLMEDEMVVGFTYRENKTWLATLFTFNFRDLTVDVMPNPGDVFRIDCIRPFTATDTVLFKVIPTDELDKERVENLDKIVVVPNPYIMTNSMEPAVRNNALNQRRRLMFKNIPATCTIKIFTMSGYLVDTIEVSNPDDNGIIHWDLLTKENLEIAAGVYVYHIKSHKTGDEKVGKFAVIK